MKRSYSFGNSVSLPLLLVHLALITLVTATMVATMPSMSLYG